MTKLTFPIIAVLIILLATSQSFAGLFCLIVLSIFIFTYMFNSRTNKSVNKIFHIKTPKLGKACATLLLSFILVFAVISFVFKERNNYQCLECLSWKHTYQWNVGSWMDFSVPITSKSSNVDVSYTSLDYKNLLKKHSHKWTFAQGSPYYAFGTRGGCAIGRGRHRNEFALVYEGYPEFREFIKSKIKSKELNEALVYQLLIMPAFSEETDTKYQRLKRLSGHLQDEYYQ